MATIRREEREHAVLVTLEHGKANAMDVELCEELASAFADLEDAPSVVLTGTGRIFSAGVDLVRLVEGGAGYVRPFLAALDRAIESWITFPRPLVAAVNGHAIAGGCLLACAADWRVMARGPGRIGVPELQVGVPFPHLALELLRSAVPAGRLRAVALRGGTVAAEEALAFGWVDALAEPGDVVPEALAVAAELAAIPRASFAHTKGELVRPILAAHAARTAAERERLVALWCAPESLAAVAAYVRRTLRR